MRFFLVLLLAIFFSAKADNISPQTLRKKFYASVDDASVAKSFLKELEGVKSTSNPLLQGYKAAVSMVMAKHSFNPYSKFKYFIDGKNDLEAAIKIYPNDIELRLIRFAIQSNVPSFLGYNSNLDEDKSFLIVKLADKQLLSADAELKDIMKRYLNDSKHCTKAEKQTINQL